MLETVPLDHSLGREEYKSRLAYLRSRLFDIQKCCWENGVGSIVVFEGWDAAGKGSTIGALTRQLEPRGFRLHAIQQPRSHEAELPWLWRFWNLLPARGEMAIFDQSWYGRVFRDRVAGTIGERDWHDAYGAIREFERTLADDGYVLIKFFLHIGKAEQAKRLRRLRDDPLGSWQLTTDVWQRHRAYGEHFVAAEEFLERTETEWGPWTIVEATDRRWARFKVFDTITTSLEASLRQRDIALPAWQPTGHAEE